jgi:hypothetical protein
METAMRVRDTHTLTDVHLQDGGEIESGALLMLEFKRRNAYLGQPNGSALWLGASTRYSGSRREL